MYIKQVFRIIRYFKRHIIIFFLMGSVVGVGEYLLLTYMRDIYNLLLPISGSEILAIAGLAIAYIVILVIGFLLIYKARTQAFSMAIEFIVHIVLNERKNDFIRNPEGLSRVLTVERERLAREVVSPILTITTKILMPILACGYIAISSPIEVGTLALPAAILVLAFIVSSSMFAYFARKLEVGLEGLGLFTHTFTRTFDSYARRMNSSGLLHKASVANKNVANAEGYIDLFSQLPRQSIDLSIYIFLLFSLLLVPNDESELINLLFLSPLLIRSLSSIQVIYKCFASIKSNVSSLSVLSGEVIGHHEEKSIIIEKRRILIGINEGELLTINNTKGTGRTVGIQLPSGYGKTNAILNLLYPDLKLPSSMALEVTGCDIKDLGYVPSEPFFDRDQLKSASQIDLHFKSFFDEVLQPTSIDPLKCSAGELFRWNLYVEMANNPRLLIIDESLIHASQAHQRKIVEYFTLGETATSLILVTHSQELILQCALQIT